MRKIEKDDMPAVMPISRRRNTMLRVMLLQLEVGEGLFLPREDWKAKNPPHYVVSNIKKSHGFRYDYGFKIDGTGWMFKRVA